MYRVLNNHSSIKNVANILCKQHFSLRVNSLRSFGTSVNDVMDLGNRYNAGKYWVNQAGIPIQDGCLNPQHQEDSSILTQIDKKLAFIALNRPKSLNSIDMDMSMKLYEKHVEYERYPDLNCIVQMGVGNKAFCSGGDLKYIYNLMKTNKKEELVKYFGQEYILDHQIANSGIPVISILNGIVMGGGVGISMNTPYAIATPNTIFSMPEVNIGFFPDTGVGKLLAQLPRGMGFYLALTGERLYGDELIHTGLCKYMIRNEDISILLDRLSLLDSRASDAVTHILTTTTEPVMKPTKEFAEFQDNVDRLFGCCNLVTDSIDSLLGRIDDMNTEWSENLKHTILKQCPLAVKLSWKVLRESIYKSNEDCLASDFRIASRLVDKSVTNDFYNGIKYFATKSTTLPSYKPNTLEQVKESKIQSFFAPFTNRSDELQFPKKRDLGKYPELFGKYDERVKRGMTKEYNNSDLLMDMLIREDNVYKKEFFVHNVTSESWVTPIMWEDEQARANQRIEFEKEMARELLRNEKKIVEDTEEDLLLKDIEL
ncbi:hypothetical protein WA158_008151 [Blastocystis sp. Blastoise]